MNPPAYVGAERTNGRTGNSGEPSRPHPLWAGGKRCPAYNRRTREVALGGRAAVGAGRSTRRSGKPATWGRARTSSKHGKEQKDLTSAVSARSVSHTAGVDRVRALQRVLYRCAKQDRDRRFHALYDKVARSDVIRRAWGEVRANRGAPGVDGITIDDVIALGVGEFLDELAAKLRADTYRPRPLRRVHIPKPGRPGQLRPLGIPTVIAYHKVAQAGFGFAGRDTSLPSVVRRAVGGAVRPSRRRRSHLRLRGRAARQRGPA